MFCRSIRSGMSSLMHGISIILPTIFGMIRNRNRMKFTGGGCCLFLGWNMSFNILYLIKINLTETAMRISERAVLRKKSFKIRMFRSP